MFKSAAPCRNRNRFVPCNAVLLFAQGAQFSASREALRRVPRAHYERLLAYSSARHPAHTAFAYWMELLWPTLLQVMSPDERLNGP
mgnify:CR=1 FL=1